MKTESMALATENIVDPVPAYTKAKGAIKYNQAERDEWE